MRSHRLLSEKDLALEAAAILPKAERRPLDGLREMAFLHAFRADGQRESFARASASACEEVDRANQGITSLRTQPRELEAVGQRIRAFGAVAAFQYFEASFWLDGPTGERFYTTALVSHVVWPARSFERCWAGHVQRSGLSELVRPYPEPWLPEILRSSAEEARWVLPHLISA